MNRELECFCLVKISINEISRKIDGIRNNGMNGWVNVSVHNERKHIDVYFFHLCTDVYGNKKKTSTQKRILTFDYWNIHTYSLGNKTMLATLINDSHTYCMYQNYPKSIVFNIVIRLILWLWWWCSGNGGDVCRSSAFFSFKIGYNAYCVYLFSYFIRFVEWWMFRQEKLIDALLYLCLMYGNFAEMNYNSNKIFESWAH